MFILNSCKRSQAEDLSQKANHDALLFIRLFHEYPNNFDNLI